MEFNRTEVYNFEGALWGMRLPLMSHHKADSEWRDGKYIIGPNDMELAQRLIKGGSEHRKFLRQILVSVAITAPLYFFKELDTYKVGTTANSSSTMHKLASMPITLDCFETEDFYNIPYPLDEQRAELKYPVDSDVIQMVLIPYLEYLRKMYQQTKDKIYWKELVRWLPESWKQTRLVTLNYEVIRNMIHQRKGHKLTEWSVGFMNWAHSLPYADELLFYGENEDA